MTRRYASPPVIEALCEIYTTGSEWDQTIPGRLYERIREQYPNRGEAREVAIEVQGPYAAPSTKVTPTEPRSQFSSEDRSRMVQVARDLVVVNQLRPYPTFAEWRPRILEMLKLYRELANPKGIRNIGVRYLNRIEIPGQVFEMDDYFGLYAEIPNALGGAHGPFLIRVEIPSETPDHRLLVTFGSAPPKKQDHSAFALDLYDTSQAVTFDNLMDVVDRAHDNIERTFEAIVTDATRTLFGEKASGR